MSTIPFDPRGGPFDARILCAHLTHEGEKKWRSVDDGVQELEERLLRGLTRDEVRVLNRSRETIIRNMTQTALRFIVPPQTAPANANVSTTSPRLTESSPRSGQFRHPEWDDSHARRRSLLSQGRPLRASASLNLRAAAIDRWLIQMCAARSVHEASSRYRPHSKSLGYRRYRC
jgi:hypothetical protein